MEGSLNKIKFAIKILRSSDEIKEILEKVLKASNKIVLNVMKPKTDIITLNENMLLSDAYEIIKKYNYTKYPVLDNEGNFIGIFYIRDFIRNVENMYEITIRKLTKPAIYIPYNYNIFQAIEFLKKKRISIALVIDEHGMVIGMITMEDLIEEIVGDIKGEYEISNIIKISDDEYKIPANISIEEFLEFIEKTFNVKLNLESNFDTISGLIFEKLNRMPNVGDKIKLDGFVFEVIETDGYRIKFLKIKKL